MPTLRRPNTTAVAPAPDRSPYAASAFGAMVQEGGHQVVDGEQFPGSARIPPYTSVMIADVSSVWEPAALRAANDNNAAVFRGWGTTNLSGQPATLIYFVNLKDAARFQTATEFAGRPVTRVDRASAITDRLRSSSARNLGFRTVGAAIGAAIGSSKYKRPYAGAAVGAVAGSILSAGTLAPLPFIGNVVIGGAGALVAWMVGRKPIEGAIVAVGANAALAAVGDVATFAGAPQIATAYEGSGAGIPIFISSRRS